MPGITRITRGITAEQQLVISEAFSIQKYNHVFHYTPGLPRTMSLKTYIPDFQIGVLERQNLWYYSTEYTEYTKYYILIKIEL